MLKNALKVLVAIPSVVVAGVVVPPLRPYFLSLAPIRIYNYTGDVYKEVAGVEIDMKTGEVYYPWQIGYDTQHSYDINTPQAKEGYYYPEMGTFRPWTPWSLLLHHIPGYLYGKGSPRLSIPIEQWRPIREKFTGRMRSHGPSLEYKDTPVA